jgi:hypothetical protein
MRNGPKRTLIIFGLLAMFLSVAQAQKFTGTITGTVTDPSGAVVPAATVSLENQATAAGRTTTTNNQGSYTFPEMSPGTYSVTVNKSGFKRTSLRNVELHVSDITTLNVQLELGSADQQVTVEASPVEVETQTGTVSNIMLGAQVRELPLNGRNFVQLTTLVPGASAAESFDAKNKGLLAGVDISFSGAPSNANEWRVDGATNNDIGSQRTILIYPSIDGIEEFKILRNSYGPEYGGAGGAQINIVTKGGGNQFHGSAYYFGRNDVLNAKNYFLGQSPGPCAPGDLSCTKQKLRRNDFGYTVGGPIKRDKLFFFWSEEWNYERRGAVRHRFVPTAAERKGDFRDLAACPNRIPLDPGNKDANGNITRPFVFNGQTNVIDPARLSPGGQAYVSMIALPNVANPCAPNNWIASVNIPIDWREENIRGDYNITKSNTLMLRYTNDAWANLTHSYPEGGLWGDSDYPALSSSWSQPGKMAVATLTSTLTSTAVNSFQFSWSANRINISPAGDNPSLNASIRAKIPTVFPISGKLQGNNLAVPYCWCGGLPSGNLGIVSPFFNRQDLFTWKDDFSKVMGKHTFKAGVLYAHNAKDEVPQGNETGNLWGATGYISPWTGTTGNWYSDLLLKGMTFGGGEAQRDNLAQIRWKDVEIYGGDSWKVSRRLNVEYGVRWSLTPLGHILDNTYAGFRPSLYNPAAGGDPCNGIVLAKGAPNDCPKIGSKITPPFASTNNLVPTNYHLFAPRLGFAWDIFGTQKAVLRGGVGQFFSRDPVGIVLRMKTQSGGNTPFGVGGAGEFTLDGPLVSSGPNQNLFDFVVGGAPHEGLENNTNLANSWQWNVTTEFAVAKDTKVEIGWVALRGIHLNSSHQANQVAPADRLSYVLRGLANSGDNRADLLPFGKLTTGGLSIWDHRGDSIYHSLQAMFSTKFTRNSIFQTAYTWSKNISTTTLSYVDATSGVADSYNSRANRGLADFDRRHLFTATMVYNLPTLEARNSFMKTTLGGWETGTIVNVATGPALTIGGSVNNVGNPWGIGVANTGGLGVARPNRVFSQPCTLGGSNRLQYLNPAAFTWDGFKLGGYPNAGPGQCPGPGTANIDLSLDKNWTLPFHGSKYFGEKSRLQFRMEMFNALNHPMFRFAGNNLAYDVQGATFSGNTVHGGTLGSSSFGQVQVPSPIGNREIQYALKLIF